MPAWSRNVFLNSGGMYLVFLPCCTRQNHLLTKNLKEPALAKTQYQSIIRLLQHSGIDTDATINNPRVKKQLSAEFDFSANGFLEADGYSYTKNEVFEELDHPDFEARFTYHRRLWNSKTILCFLEEKAFNYFDFNDELKEYYHDTDFDHFFSPYFSLSFNYGIRTFLNDHRFEDASRLLLFENFLVPDDREEAFSPLRIYLEENLRILRNINEENYSAFSPQAAHWTFPSWAHMLNSLPDELYDKQKEIAFYLVNITVAIQKKHPKDCKKISQELTHLTGLPEDLGNTIASNHKVYKGSSSGTPWGVIVWVVIILLRVMSGC